MTYGPRPVERRPGLAPDRRTLTTRGDAVDDVNRVMADRLRKLDELREAGVNPFANGFEPTATCAELLAAAAAETPPGMTEVPEDAPQYAVAGRLVGGLFVEV